VLVLDFLIHGYVDLDDPTKPIYAYEVLYDELLSQRYTPGRRIDTFAIGGGSYTFPRYMESRYSGRVVVAEIDPVVTSVARDYLALRPGPRMRIYDDDARRVLGRLGPDDRFDVVAGDAFNDAAVPYHLTTFEFDELVARHLKPDGVYMVNVVDGVHHAFLRSFVRTMQRVFPQVRVMSGTGIWPPSPGRETFVVVGSRTPLPETTSLVSTTEVDAFLALPGWTLLTDDHVPTDQLLAPVFRQRLER